MLRKMWAGYSAQTKRTSLSALRALAIVIGMLPGVAQPGLAQSLQTLHAFNVVDGYIPLAGLVRDAKGNFYGTTQGSSQLCTGGMYCGTVYQLSKTGAFNNLYLFSGKEDGAFPGYGALVLDSSNNLYGTTQGGGTHGFGTVFKVTPKGKESVLWNFTGGKDGSTPYGGVLFIGNTLYGTTFLGGKKGNGIVFSLTGSKLTVLHSFAGGTTDGAAPWSGVAADKKGNLYGTASAGGANGFGIVYKVSSAGKYSVLYSFQGGDDGAQPRGGLILDSAKNLYGTTYSGGKLNLGTIFKVSAQGQEETLLNDFRLDPPNENPVAGLVRDGSGNLYGTTFNVIGSVFKLDTSSQITDLWQFKLTDGEQPTGVLILDASGNLYGTTDGPGGGTIFKLIP